MTTSALHHRDICVSTLPNGLSVVSETMPHVRSVAVGVWVRTGARQERPEQNGLSHFLEHMVFQGTAHYSAEEIARSVDSIGGNLDAYTAKELVSYNAKVLDEHLPAAFDVLADLVRRPLFRDADVAKEKGVILEEIKMESDSPEYLVHELFCSRFWENHSLGRPVLGSPGTVESFTREMLLAYHQSIYTPSNLLITAAGRVRHEDLLELVESEFADLPPGAAPPPGPQAETCPHLQVRNKESLEQIHICLGAPAYPVNHELRYACYVLNSILGGGMSSRLFQNIREKRGLVYSIFSELSLYHDTGCLLVNAGASVERAEEVVRLVLEELTRLKEEPVPDEELARAVNQLKGSLMLSLESSSARMANLARQQMYFGRFFELDEILDGLDAVMSRQLQDVAQTFFQPGKLALTVLGPVDGFSLPGLAC